MRTGNGLLDVLLTEKRRQCLAAGMRPTFFVDGSRLGFINDFDLCTLIGNAADNAIEATPPSCRWARHPGVIMVPVPSSP